MRASRAAVAALVGVSSLAGAAAPPGAAAAPGAPAGVRLAAEWLPGTWLPGTEALADATLGPVPATSWLDVATATVTNLSALLQLVFSSPAPVLHELLTIVRTDPGRLLPGLAEVFSAQTLTELARTLAAVPVYPLAAAAAAFSASVEEFGAAVQDADPAGALQTLVQSPAVLTGAFLNGFPDLDPNPAARIGIDPAGALLTNITTGPDFGSLANLLALREIVADALGAGAPPDPGVDLLP